MWTQAIPFTNPSTAPVISDTDATRAFELALERLELASGPNMDEYLAIAETLHRGLRNLQRNPEIWLALAEVAARLSYVGGDEYDEVGIDWSLSLIDRALELAPDLIDARALKAEILMIAGQFREGGAALAGLPSDHWRVASATGRLCAVTGNPIVLRKAWRTAANQAPPRRKAALLDRLGTELFDLGRVDEACEAMRQSLALRPDRAWGHYNLAMMLSRIGRRNEALESVRRALALSEFPAARDLEERLRAKAPPVRSPPEMLSFCATCASPWRGEPCPKCRACDGKVELTEVEVHQFRRIPCKGCGQPMIGFATRCALCKTPK